MRLTPAQVKRTLNQIDAQQVMDTDPLASRLNEVFGDHTFFLDGNGLNIVETVAASDDGGRQARLLNVASWTDATLTSLAPHAPETTGTVLDLETKH
jgi:hypothetical protein